MKDTEYRLDELFTYSDHIYSAIDQTVENQPRHRIMLRQGVQAAATALAVGVTADSTHLAGQSIHTVLTSHLRLGGLPENVLTTWPAPALRSDQNEAAHHDPRIDTLAQLYADTTRVTRDRSGTFETDSSHAVHLTALAGMYVGKYHPELNFNLVLTYALLHDIVEAYSGDTASFGLSEEGHLAKEEIENAALYRIKSELQIDYPGFVQIIEGYEQLKEPESRFVKSFDKLDPGFTWLYSSPREMLENLPHITSRAIHAKFRAEAAEKVARHCGEFPDVLKLYFEMSRRVDAHIRLPHEADDYQPDTSDIDKLELRTFDTLQ